MSDETVVVRFSGNFIYGDFPSLAHAHGFAAEASAATGRGTAVFANAPESAHEHEPFPVVQDGFVVHVARPEVDDTDESVLERLARKHGGEYWGT